MGNAIEDLERMNRDVRSGLKDFQLETVDRVLEVFKTRNRVLVSDEVGLGKTMIAQGVIAGMAMENRKDDRPFNVVYVCSNAAIAEQNLSKLRFSSNIGADEVGSSRLSMQHFQIAQLQSQESYQKQAVHLIPLMPYTSFNVWGGGTARERALIYTILKAMPMDELPQLHEVIEPLGVLMGVDAPVSWKDWMPYYVKEVSKYPSYLKRITHLVTEVLKERQVQPPKSALHAERAQKEETPKGLLLDEVCRITKAWWTWRQCQVRRNDGCPFEEKKKGTEESPEEKERRKAELIREWPGCKEAARELGCNEENFNGCNYKRLASEAYWMFEQLRLLFAGISLEELHPDLVIMDEFQRFRDVIKAQPDTDAGLLKKKFFEESNTKMLLLSATPYKMYSTLEEYDETRIDEHYQEFLDVMKFLNPEKQEKKAFEDVWRGYSKQLKQLSCGDAAVLHVEDILKEKQRAENAMYAAVCRTERGSDGETAELVKHEMVCGDTSHRDISWMTISADDVLSYVHAQDLIRELKSVSKKQTRSGFMPVDYVKSCPYVMSFLQGYALNDWVKNSARSIEDTKSGKTEKLLAVGEELWLKEERIETYQDIPCRNARLQSLMERILPKDGKEAQYLWVPPSLPYHPLKGVYENAGAFTKTLVFSAWQMVPRMISTLVSYEVERRTIGQIVEGEGQGARYPYKRTANRYLASRLRFRTMQAEEREPGKRPQNMTIFCLLYPSQYLANQYCPLECLNKGMSLTSVQAKLKWQIEMDMGKALERSNVHLTDSGNEDRAWYYLAPLLLDVFDANGGGENYVRGWLKAAKVLESSAGENLSEEDAAGETGKSSKRSNNVAAYLGKLQEMLESVIQAMESQSSEFPLGKMPKDLYDVLADMAIGSPAICFHRSYQLYGMEPNGAQATEAAMTLLSRMDTPEALAVVQTASQQSIVDDAAAVTAHWRNFLTYSVNGCLQAVLDEYLHMLASGMPKTQNLASILHRMVLNGLRIHTASYPVITSHGFAQLCREGRGEALRMRTHYAVAFAKTESEKQNQDKDFNRKKVVRQAFNTPFWPFVLATTSIGHEGLDFHNYCRRVVHWNLPSNPIDLEQREGRIHRYKCLAIRQNVAKRYGHGPVQFQKDAWEELFDRAAQEEKGTSSSDLIPFWGLHDSEDLIHIERMVPSYPLSRDEWQYQRLIEILSLYRLTLGQPNQDELLQSLKEQFGKAGSKGQADQLDLTELFFNLSPFYRKQAATADVTPTSE